MLLADQEIQTLVEGRQIGITPFHPECLNPASVDLTLHPVIRIPSVLTEYIDVASVPEGYTEPFDMVSSIDGQEDGWRLDPGDFILASTTEVIELPDDITARVEGKSSIGRLGMAVHVTAGYIDPGFRGQVTLEIANLAPWTIRIRPHMRIAQIAFTRMSEPAARPYNEVGHYSGQVGPTESRYRYKVPTKI
jgi:dCTP deaminase